MQKEIYHSFGGNKEFNGEIRNQFGISIGWRISDKEENYFWRKSDDCNYDSLKPRGHLPSCLWAGIDDDWLEENRRSRLITLFYHLEDSGISNISKCS